MQFISPTSRKVLVLSSDNITFMDSDKSYPIINQIPRFVSTDNYANSFGLQWNTFRKTQLDSYTNTTISKDRLERICGGNLSVFKDKTVLEVGCGSGRFSEVMLQAGAILYATDISSAVDAAYENLKNYPNYHIFQADVRNLPLPTASFDIVLCIGVIQHTPDPEQTMELLTQYIKPNGLLMLDHYTHGYPVTWSRLLIRNFLLNRSPNFSIKFCINLVSCLWGIHLFLWKLGGSNAKLKTMRLLWRFYPIFKSMYEKFIQHSPVVDYHLAYPQLDSKLLKQWAILDTHDTLTDHYKHLRSAEQIKIHLEKCGMTDIKTTYAGNGVEAIAKKIN